MLTNGVTGKFRELQRLTVQYARILELTDDDEEAAGEEKAEASTEMVVS